MPHLGGANQKKKSGPWGSTNNPVGGEELYLLQMASGWQGRGQKPPSPGMPSAARWCFGNSVPRAAPGPSPLGAPQVRMLELERTQHKMLLESLKQRHQEDLDLLERAHRYRALTHSCPLCCDLVYSSVLFPCCGRAGLLPKSVLRWASTEPHQFWPGGDPQVSQGEGLCSPALSCG